MAKNLEEILKLIEQLRNKLHSSAEGKVLTDQEVIKASLELNKMLNEYDRLLNQKKTKD